MCSFQEAIPYVALAVFSAADWEVLLRDRVDGLLPGGGSGPRRDRADGEGGS